VGWLRVWLAIAVAIVFFRVGRMVMALIFFFIQFAIPMNSGHAVIAGFDLLHRWDFALTLLAAITSAVVASRWVERKMLSRSFRAGLVASIVFTALGAFPFTLRFEESATVVMSPLELAIHDHYSMATVEAIIDHKPRMVNGEKRSWGGFTPLVDAAYENRVDLVELLIRKGANVDAAVKELQQMNEESAVKLVLDCSNLLQKSAPTNSAPSTQTH